MRSRLTRIAMALVVVGLILGWGYGSTSGTSQAAPPSASFVDLGNLGAPEFGWHFAAGVSDDGSMVVGQSNSTPTVMEAFRWTAEEGMVGLGFLPGGNHDSVAWAVSGDATTIAGSSDTASGVEAFRWTSAGGMVGLGHLPGGGTFSEGNAISTDGFTIVGGSDTASGFEAFLWTPADGMQGLGFLQVSSYSVAYAVSGDGSTVFGESESASGFEAFRWTAADGMLSLGDLPGGDVAGGAEGASSNGKFVVGRSSSAASGSGNEPFLWSQHSGTMIGLGDLPGGAFAGQANAVSDNGSRVVGNSHIGLPPVPGEPVFSHGAFVWDKAFGMRNLQSVLENDFGVDTLGVTMHSATGISANGTTIVGWGTRTASVMTETALSVTLPLPAIGGTFELLADGSDAPRSAADGSASSFPYALLAGGLAAAVALEAGGWYARRRFRQRRV